MIRLKDGVSPEILRDYGFHPGREDFGKERWCGNGIGYACQAAWYHKFLTYNEDTGEYGEGYSEIAYTDDKFDIPMVQMSFRIGNSNDLYVDCAPSGTYYIGGIDLAIVTETVFAMTQAGLLEVVNGDI